ncbi:MAG: aldo/keto reductase [Phycisphaeraceae bacterium]
MTDYTPDANRYDNPAFYRPCGRWGLKLPAISLGCWHNFGTHADEDNARQMLFTAFDHGITHFDLANNYGPVPGSAEERVGEIMIEMPRDEIIISTKAGYLMWPGPYGEWGSRKYLLASLEQSLERLDLEYVDIFYSHRWDPNTPLEETMGALDTAVKQGKALYTGISSYNAEQTRRAMFICRENGFAQPIIHQPNYSILNRWIETKGLMQTCQEQGLGIIAFCPLYQGVLTDKYLAGVPKGSRAANPEGFLREKQLTPDLLAAVGKLNDVAKQRGQSLAQMALSWVLRDPRVTTALIGASRPEQIKENVKAADKLTFSDEERMRIDEACRALNLKSAWASGEE